MKTEILIEIAKGYQKIKYFCALCAAVSVAFAMLSAVVKGDYDNKNQLLGICAGRIRKDRSACEIHRRAKGDL